MHIPAIVSKATAAALASPTETHAVRVLLHSVANGGQFRLRCRSRQYLFDKCGLVGRHLLEIPLSVWMEGSPTKSFRENKSISEDFRTANNCPFSIQVVPWKGTPAVQNEQSHFLPILREILRSIDAPPVVEEAFKLIDAGNLGEMQDLAEFLKATAKEAPPAADPGESPAAARMRKMREAKAAKKAQLATD